MHNGFLFKYLVNVNNSCLRWNVKTVGPIFTRTVNNSESYMNPSNIAQAINAIPESVFTNLLSLFGRSLEHGSIQIPVSYGEYLALIEAHLQSADVSGVMDNWWRSEPSSETDGNDAESFANLSLSPRERLLWLRTGVNYNCPSDRRSKNRWFSGLLHPRSAEIFRAEGAFLCKMSQQKGSDESTETGAWCTPAEAILSVTRSFSEGLQALYEQQKMRSSGPMFGIGWSLAAIVSSAEAENVDSLGALYSFEAAITKAEAHQELIPRALKSELYSGR